jgi:hypothetical protein
MNETRGVVDPTAASGVLIDPPASGNDAGYRMPFDNRRICARMLLDEALVNLRLMPRFHPVFSVDQGRAHPWVDGSTGGDLVEVESGLLGGFHLGGDFRDQVGPCPLAILRTAQGDLGDRAGQAGEDGLKATDEAQEEVDAVARLVQATPGRPDLGFGLLPCHIVLEHRIKASLPAATAFP